MIKKLFLFFLMPFSLLFAELPENLAGIWEGKDRYIFFEEDENQKEQIAIVLKSYYGWYLDRVSEDKKYSGKYPRDRNNATTKDSITILTDFEKIKEEKGSGVYETLLTYSKSEKTYIPFCLIDDKIYFDFFFTDSENPNFWKGNVKSEGFTVSNQAQKEKFDSYFISGDDSYKIRYWITEMDYDNSAKAQIKDGEKEFSIYKHIFSAGKTYTCADGKRTVIRNLQKSLPFDGREVIYNDEKTIAAYPDSYVKKLIDKKTFEDLVGIVKEQNARRRPDPPPLFPEKELDFHWDLIDALEKDNEMIKKVRERQKEFGIRGKDINK